MTRYLIEVAYKGTAFRGFQSQKEGITVQGEINRAIGTVLKTAIETTPSSRTDAGVHAHQNFLHVDLDTSIPPSLLYNANAVIHEDIVIRRFIPIASDIHARFNATGRSYSYHIIQSKNPFLKETAYFFPFKLDLDAMQQATQILFKHIDYTSFSKRHTDVFTFNCEIQQAEWFVTDEELLFKITANRFLRGMVRAIVGTLLQVGRNKISVNNFEDIILAKDCQGADFSAEAKGLFLEKVHYPFLP